MKILFLSSWFPYPPSNGSKLRVYHLLRGLAQQHDVTLLSFADGVEGEAGAAALRTLCGEVKVVQRKEFQPNSRRAWFGLLTPTPRSLQDTFSPTMEQEIEQTLRKQRYDLVIASQLGLAAYASSFQSVRALFEEVEIGALLDRFVHASSLRSRLRHGLTWAKHRRYVTRLLRSFRACTVASSTEKQLLAQIAPAYQAVHVLPNCVRVADYAWSPVVHPDRLIFTGSFRYLPNYEAMQWFVREVYPQIKTKVSGVTLTITGDHANLPLPADESVTLTGFVDDVQRQIAQSSVSVAPIHNGGGTRLKILEAMASGTAVVTTSKGAEGLDVQHERHLLIADTPELFAEGVVRLLRQPQLRQQMAANAYAKVCEAYDWDATMPRFLHIVEQVASQ